MLTRLYSFRFEFFFASQIAILFGSLIIPSAINGVISPIFFYLNVIAGSLFIGTRKKYHLKLIIFFLILGTLFMTSSWIGLNEYFMNITKFILLFVFHIIVAFQIIKQIWFAKVINKKVIFGIMSGYISLGLIGFFIFLSIEIVHPGSFKGLSVLNAIDNAAMERLMYFSYITLMTIGYGDILPQTLLAQKATILIGLSGQFYLVIITAIVVGKFISQTKKTKE